MYSDREECVSHLLRQHDPIGLIAMGAPEDEYDPELGTILPRLADARSEADVLAILQEEFARWFGEEYAEPKRRYAALAKDIWRLCLGYRGGAA